MFYAKRFNCLFSNQMICSSMMVLMCTILVAIVCTSVEAREMQYAGQHTAIRRLDCDVFCRQIKINAFVGGCHCGLTLFSNKRSLMPPRFFQPSTSKLFKAEAVYNTGDDSDEDSIDNNNINNNNNNLGSKSKQLNLSNRLGGDNLD